MIDNLEAQGRDTKTNEDAVDYAQYTYQNFVDDLTPKDAGKKRIGGAEMVAELDKRLNLKLENPSVGVTLEEGNLIISFSTDRKEYTNESHPTYFSSDRPELGEYLIITPAVSLTKITIGSDWKVKTEISDLTKGQDDFASATIKS